METGYICRYPAIFFLVRLMMYMLLFTLILFCMPCLQDNMLENRMLNIRILVYDTKEVIVPALPWVNFENEQ